MATGCTLRPTTDPQSCQKMSDVKQQRTAAFVLRHWSLQKSHAAPYAWSESLLPCGGEGDRRPDEGDDRHHVLRGNKATVVHSGKRTSRICRSANGRVESATAGEDRPAMGGETTAPSQHAQPWHFFREDHGVCSSGGAILRPRGPIRRSSRTRPIGTVRITRFAPSDITTSATTTVEKSSTTCQTTRISGRIWRMLRNFQESALS